MPQDMLAQLQAIDRETLTAIVREDLGSPAAEITAWSVERLSGKGMINPENLFCFSGQARIGQETKPWRVVLKIIHQPDEQGPLHTVQDPRSMWYWKREFLAAESRLLERLPGLVVAPRVYAVSEHTESAWLWLEYIESGSPSWTLEQYAFVARELGRCNGAGLSQIAPPDYPWLCTEHCRWQLALWERYQPDRVRDNPFVQRAFTESVLRRVDRLWAEKETFLHALTRVPQVVSHFDTQRRNLFIRPRADGVDEVVAIDWAFVGRDALGGDLVALVGVSALLFEVEPEEVPALEAVTLDAYLAGLSEAGWTGDPDLVHLAYRAWFALHFGANAPVITAIFTSEARREYSARGLGREPEAMAAGWATLCAIALDHADEARRLMGRLGFG